MICMCAVKCRVRTVVQCGVRSVVCGRCRVLQLWLCAMLVANNIDVLYDWEAGVTEAVYPLLMYAQGYYDCPLCPSDSCRLRTTSRDFVRRHLFVKHDGKDFKTHYGGRFGGIFAEVWQLIGAKRQYRDETIRGIDHDTKLPTEKTRKRRRRQNERMTEHVTQKYGAPLAEVEVVLQDDVAVASAASLLSPPAKAARRGTEAEDSPLTSHSSGAAGFKRESNLSFRIPKVPAHSSSAGSSGTTRKVVLQGEGATEGSRWTGSGRVGAEVDRSATSTSSSTRTGSYQQETSTCVSVRRVAACTEASSTVTTVSSRAAGEGRPAVKKRLGQRRHDSAFYSGLDDGCQRDQLGTYSFSFGVRDIRVHPSEEFLKKTGGRCLVDFSATSSVAASIAARGVTLPGVEVTGTSISLYRPLADDSYYDGSRTSSVRTGGRTGKDREQCKVTFSRLSSTSSTYAAPRGRQNMDTGMRSPLEGQWRVSSDMRSATKPQQRSAYETAASVAGATAAAVVNETAVGSDR